MIGKYGDILGIRTRTNEKNDFSLICHRADIVQCNTTLPEQLSIVSNIMTIVNNMTSCYCDVVPDSTRQH